MKKNWWAQKASFWESLIKKKSEDISDEILKSISEDAVRNIKLYLIAGQPICLLLEW